MKILMATDGSRDATAAMISATRLLRKEELQADVLFIAPELALHAGAAVAGARRRTHASYRQQIRKEGEQVARRAQHTLHREGLNATPIVEFGSPADQIIRLASDYDVVVVGAHGRYERRQPGLGPVSSLVAQNSPRTVMIGRELANESNYRVLVALDGSNASFNALAALGVWFDVSSMDVTLMHVVETPWARLRIQEPGEEAAIEPTELEDYQRELERELRLDSQTTIDRGLRQLEKWGVPATTVVEEGAPALELTSHAEAGNYDLIIVGATGLSDVKHALLGSVSLKLAWDSPCSVLVART
jgi:nucleotide-binding universal stress UspA family protein